MSNAVLYGRGRVERLSYPYIMNPSIFEKKMTNVVTDLRKGFILR